MRLKSKAVKDAEAEGPHEGKSQAIKDRWVRQIIAVAKDIRRYQITSGEDLQDVKPGKEPYSRPGSYEFFMDVRRGRLDKVREALQNDRFLVFAHNEMD